MARERISAAEARRLALAVAGASPTRARTASRAAGTCAGCSGGSALLQIDSVNVLERAHYLPAFSRLGPYDHERLDRLSHRAPRRLFEYWGHEASLLPVDLHPLLRWRMERAGERRLGRHARDRTTSARTWSPRCSSRCANGGRSPPRSSTAERPRRSGPWWDWSDSKRALEWLFWSGR